jgi:hypothetical protein
MHIKKLVPQDFISDVMQLYVVLAPPSHLEQINKYRCVSKRNVKNCSCDALHTMKFSIFFNILKVCSLRNFSGTSFCRIKFQKEDKFWEELGCHSDASF